MMKGVFLDFDGVIIDSIDECYLVSKDLYQELYPDRQLSDEHKRLFYKHRGIVGPAWQFVELFRAIDAFLSGEVKDIHNHFYHLCQDREGPERNRAEKRFFEIRKTYQADSEEWFRLNRITEFGKWLQNRKLDGHHIVTTKNREAVELLLEHYHIEIPSIWDAADYRRSQTKGVLIAKLMDKQGYQEGIFVDDSVKHLDTVYDPRIQCYFADWGYGENTTYPVFEKELWK